MKKYNLQEWIESGVAEEYNLIADTQEEEDDDFGMIESPYEKFFIYKYIKEFQEDSIWEKMGEKVKKSFEEKANMYKSINDPDSYSELLQEVYKLLWKNVAEQPFMRQEPKKKEMKGIWEDGKKSASDAMTSVQGILKAALQNIISGPKETKLENMSEEIFGHIQKMMEGAFKTNLEYWTKKFCVAVAADLSTEKLDKIFYDLIDKYYPNNILGEFMNRCFTVGNYCPVPKGFNSARSGQGACHDYWDLTLIQIRKWYLEDDDKELMMLLHCDTFCEKVKNCKEWLSWTANGDKKEKAWRRFVDSLLMQDYVWNEDDGIDKGNEKYYQVKEFWPNHSWENSELPKDDEKIKEALKGIIERIAKRSHRIVEELKCRKFECH